MIVLFSSYTYQEIYIAKLPNSDVKTTFLIKKGEKVKEIANNLERKNLIKSAFLFQIYILIKGEAGKLQAGSYELSSSMNIPKIASYFVSGKTIKEKITIIEGWDLNDIGNYLDKKNIVSKKDFVEYGIKNKLEGYLFPDTYEICPKSNVAEIANKMVVNFNRKLTPKLREEIAKKNKTIAEVITMASLIEKEAKDFNDKKIVSGILWKRLKYGIPLQVDATINYITGKKGLKITKEETKIDSRYNTYKYKGLPPGPICNPGLESIIAAIEPQKSPNLYYLSDSNGKIYFSKTLKEHNIKKDKYIIK